MEKWLRSTKLSFDNYRQLMAVLTLILSVIVYSGCDEDRLATYSVSGKVLVDGKPEKGVVLQLVPIETNPLRNTRLRPGAVTDERGEFLMTTYSIGDGAPDGTYKLILFWPPEQSDSVENNIADMRERMAPGPPDVFGGKYFLPEDSQIEVTVQGESIELETIQLEWKQ